MPHEQQSQEAADCYDASTGRHETEELLGEGRVERHPLDVDWSVAKLELQTGSHHFSYATR